MILLGVLIGVAASLVLVGFSFRAARRDQYAPEREPVHTCWVPANRHDRRALAVMERRVPQVEPREYQTPGAGVPGWGRTQVRSRQSYARVRCDKRRAAWRAERSGR